MTLIGGTKKDKFFDIIIVGSGSAGTVMANRLSENISINVLVLEAGNIYTSKKFPKVISDPDSTEENKKYIFQYGKDVIGGRILSGSSAINACAALRARKTDFDTWDQSIWSYDKILETYIKLENSNMYYKNKKFHNNNGPFPINQLKMKDITPSCRAFVKSAMYNGLKFIDDFNGEEQYGVGPYPKNVVNNIRQNVAMSYLNENVRKRPNLTIQGNSFVTKLLFENQTVKGVSVIDKYGKTKIYFANKEVIISAGVYGSPLIFIRSGIGPKEELDKLGISIIADLPIGKKLYDHPMYYCMFKLKKDFIDDGPSLGALAWIQSSNEKIMKDNKSDVLDLQLVAFSSTGEIGIGIGLTQPESIGYITYEKTSNNGSIKPIIHSNFLKEDIDKIRMREGINLTRKISHTKPLSDIIDFEKSDENDVNILQNLHHFQHGCGTIPMGNILDWYGNLIGFKNLRVVDASIMSLPSCPTNLTVIMIAERIAESMI